MQYNSIANGELKISSLGLGTSRLGSVLSGGPESKDHVVRTAIDCGITFFDTADIYGQGDSERILGRNCRGSDEVVICTKVGQYFPLYMRMLLPFKKQITSIVSRSGSAAGQLAGMRSKRLPQCFQSDYIRKAAEKSLRRLDRDCLDILLLHSVPEEEIRKGEGLDTLSRLKEDGKIRVIGVSVDDIGAAKAALEDQRVQIVELPLVPGDREFLEISRQMTSKGIATIAREVLGGPAHLARFEVAKRKSFINGRIRELLSDQGITNTIIGTNNVAHIQEIARLAE